MSLPRPFPWATIIFLLVAGIYVAFPAYSQTFGGCHTPDGNRLVEPCVMLSFKIVHNEEGEPPFSARTHREVSFMVDQANRKLRNDQNPFRIGIGEIIEIQSEEFYNFEFSWGGNNDYRRLEQLAQEPGGEHLAWSNNFVNVYIVDRFTPDHLGGLCGSPHFNVMASSSPGVLIHELGHSMGLPHTFASRETQDTCLPREASGCDDYCPHEGNFMSYTSSSWFSPCQKARLLDALDPVDGRVGYAVMPPDPTTSLRMRLTMSNQEISDSQTISLFDGQFRTLRVDVHPGAEVFWHQGSCDESQGVQSSFKPFFIEQFPDDGESPRERGIYLHHFRVHAEHVGEHAYCLKQRVTPTSSQHEVREFDLVLSVLEPVLSRVEIESDLVLEKDYWPNPVSEDSLVLFSTDYPTESFSWQPIPGADSYLIHEQYYPRLSIRQASHHRVVELPGEDPARHSFDTRSPGTYQFEVEGIVDERSSPRDNFSLNLAAPLEREQSDNFTVSLGERLVLRDLLLAYLENKWRASRLHHSSCDSIEEFRESLVREVTFIARSSEGTVLFESDQSHSGDREVFVEDIAVSNDQLRPLLAGIGEDQTVSEYLGQTPFAFTGELETLYHLRVAPDCAETLMPGGLTEYRSALRLPLTNQIDWLSLWNRGYQVEGGRLIGTRSLSRRRNNDITNLFINPDESEVRLVLEGVIDHSGGVEIEAFADDDAISAIDIWDDNQGSNTHFWMTTTVQTERWQSIVDIPITLTDSETGLYKIRSSLSLERVDFMAPFQRGDFDLNGAIDLPDAISVLEYLFFSKSLSQITLLPAPQALHAADANMNCSIEIADAIHILNYLFQGGPIPGTAPIAGKPNALGNKICVPFLDH